MKKKRCGTPPYYSGLLDRASKVEGVKYVHEPFRGSSYVAIPAPEPSDRYLPERFRR